MTLLEAYNMPFAAALIVMVALFVIQLFGFLDIDFDLDAEADGDAAISGGALGGLLTLLGLGRVPLTIWLVVFLLVFAAIGVSIQGLADSLTGAPLDRWLAALFAAAGALPVTAAIARPLGAILPQDETSAVDAGTLLGRRGVITDGTARAGSPARARVRDAFGHDHYVMVEPHEADSQLPAGDEVLLVRREGNQFYATALAERRLSPQSN